MILVVQEVMTLCSTMASPHSDYLRLQEENYRVKIAYHREKQDILLQIKL